MKIRKSVAALMMLTSITLTAACSTDSTSSSSTSSTSSTSTAQSGTAVGAGMTAPGGVDVSSVSTEAELIAMIQSAYGDANLDLHRGHQPVESVLDEVLGISHEELHTRMESGQNLAAVATDLGIDPQTLIDAMVASWSPAIDTLVESGEITSEEGEQYLAALEEAFSFRVNWNGSDATPTFSGLT